LEGPIKDILTSEIYKQQILGNRVEYIKKNNQLSKRFSMFIQNKNTQFDFVENDRLLVKSSDLEFYLKVEPISDSFDRFCSVKVTRKFMANDKEICSRCMDFDQVLNLKESGC